MSDALEDRPTIPNQVFISWAGNLGSGLDLPISPARAKQLAEALSDYEKRCVEVKRALQDNHDDGGAAYRLARERKHAQFNQVLAMAEHVMAYIGVHAR